MLLEGVTGITTWTAPSMPCTTSRNFCFPSSTSSITSSFSSLHSFSLRAGSDVSLTARIDRPPPNFLNLSGSWRAVSEHREISIPAHYILFPPANSFSTSARITSAPANSILPTRCQRMTPFWSITYTFGINFPPPYSLSVTLAGSKR